VDLFSIDKNIFYHETNPLQLREEIYALIDHLFSLSNAVPGVTENVYELVGLLREESLSNAVPGVTENVYELVGLLREEHAAD